MKSVYLNISEISSFIGYNPYDNITPFERLWKRCDSEEYNSLLNKMCVSLLYTQVEFKDIKESEEKIQEEFKNKNITKRQYNIKIKDIEEKKKIVSNSIEEIVSKIDNIKLTKSEQIEKSLGTDTLNKINDSLVSTEIKRDQIKKIIENKDIDDKSKEILLKQTENVINTTHGVLKEDSAIAQYEEKFKVKLDVSQYYNKKQFIQTKLFNYYIGGKVDGLYIDSDPSKSYVVEVKNRTKGFFSSLRDYENTQIQLYMWILELNEAKLVEKYKDKLRITVIYRDQIFIDSIMEYLSIFVNNFENNFILKNKTKELYINKSEYEKKIFFNKLYLTDIQNAKNYTYEKNIIENENDCLIDDLD
jgi:nicotinamide mononucleotide adenylyltransferase